MHGYSTTGRHSTLSTVGAADAVSFSGVAAHSPAFRQVLERARRFAATDASVLIQGEPGTGKTMIAHHLHRLSRRSAAPFRTVNLAGLDDALAGCALFGHEDNAFTGAKRRRPGALQEAQGGTLFLDELGKSSVPVQGKLLDVIQTHTFYTVGGDRLVHVDVRLIFAANESLETLVESGRMLRDFLPRLGLFRIELPALRDRREDIPVLLRRFVETFAPSAGYSRDTSPRIHEELERCLAAFEWPDNVRELESLTQRLLVDAQGAPELTPSLLVEDLEKYRCRPRTKATREIERRIEAENAVRRTNGNRAQAARELGISRPTLYRRLEDPAGEFAAGGSGAEAL